MPNSVDSRVAVLEAVIPRIEAYMKQGAEIRVQNTKDITEIKTCVVDLKDYTVRCDTERGLQADRIRKLEDGSNFQKGWVAAIAGVFGVIGGIAGEIWKR